MSDPVHVPSVKGLAKKKVAGVPVLYIGAALVAVLAVYAYKMKASPATPAGDATDAPAAPDLTSPANAAYPAPTDGSVTVTSAPIPAGDNTGAGNASIETAEDWVRKGVSLLSTKYGVSGGVAQRELGLYLDGHPLSVTQAKHRDIVIKAYGLPPNFIATSYSPADIVAKPAATVTVQFLAKRTGLWAVYAAQSNGTRRWINPAEFTALRAQGKRLTVYGPSDPFWTAYRLVGTDAPKDGKNR